MGKRGKIAGNKNYKRTLRSISGYKRAGKSVPPYKAHRWLSKARKVILPAHETPTERPFVTGPKRQRPFKSAVVYNMRLQLNQPESTSRKLFDELSAHHPLLVGFTVDIPKDYNQYGVFIGQSTKKDQPKFVSSEVRNIRLIPILAVTRKELEDPERIKQLTKESEQILSEIDEKKDKDLFPEWQKNPKIQVFFNLNKEGKRVHEVGLLDLEQANPGEAISIQNELVLTQKVDRRGGFTGPDYKKARHFVDNERVIVYHLKLKEYRQASEQLQRETDPAKRAALARILYGDSKDGRVKDTGTLALEPYLKENYLDVLDILQKRGVKVIGNDEGFKKKKGGKYDFSFEGQLKGPMKDRWRAFRFQDADSGRPFKEKKLYRELSTMTKENLKIGKEADIRQRAGEQKYYTEKVQLKPVARDLTTDETDEKTKENPYAPFRDVVYQDLTKIRAIRKWLSSAEEADDKTKVKGWAIFVNDAIQRNIESREKPERERLNKIKTFHLNPMVMEESDIKYVEDQLQMTIPRKPPLKAPLPLDFIQDQILFPPAEVIERPPKPPTEEYFPSIQEVTYEEPEAKEAAPSVFPGGAPAIPEAQPPEAEPTPIRPAEPPIENIEEILRLAGTGARKLEVKSSEPEGYEYMFAKHKKRR